jgi:RNA polymerase sporulation-specific sigma factor
LNGERQEEKFIEEQLAILAREGNEEAEEYLIRKYKEVVKTKAHLYFIAGADRDDIVQEGMIGIFKAIKGFDPSRQASFRTFAELCINRQIITAIKQATRRKHSPLNTSVSLSKPIDGNTNTVTLAETLSTGSDSDPVEQLLLKETMDILEGTGSGFFSALEQCAWTHYLQGKTYREIAEILEKSPKSIDNAIQRTKRKMAGFLVKSR